MRAPSTLRARASMRRLWCLALLAVAGVLAAGCSIDSDGYGADVATADPEAALDSDERAGAADESGQLGSGELPTQLAMTDDADPDGDPAGDGASSDASRDRIDLDTDESVGDATDGSSSTSPPSSTTSRPNSSTAADEDGVRGAAGSDSSTGYGSSQLDRDDESPDKPRVGRLTPTPVAVPNRIDASPPGQVSSGSQVGRVSPRPTATPRPARVSSGQAADPTPTSFSIPAVQSPANSARATATPRPALQARPTIEPRATATPRPTAPPRATATPRPAAPRPTSPPPTTTPIAAPTPCPQQAIAETDQVTSLTSAEQLQIAETVIDCAGFEAFTLEALGGVSFGVPDADVEFVEQLPRDLSSCLDTSLGAENRSSVLLGLISLSAGEAPNGLDRANTSAALASCAPPAAVVGTLITALVFDFPGFESGINPICAAEGYDASGAAQTFWQRILADPSIDVPAGLSVDELQDMFNPILNCLSFGTVVVNGAATENVGVPPTAIECIDAAVAADGLLITMFSGTFAADDPAITRLLINCLTG